LYLWIAVIIFGAASAITRKLTEIASQHLIHGHNPISFCNTLLVGNLCALGVLVLLYGWQWKVAALRQIPRQQWLGLISVALLAGALAPALFFQALALTPVNNIVLVGRLEPPLTLILSVWWLRPLGSSGRDSCLYRCDSDSLSPTYGIVDVSRRFAN
jgi:drug/metabolite transporter (DMT)-like permease